MNRDRHVILKTWIAAILWLIVIAIESTALASSENTSRILYPVLHYLFNMDWEHFDYWHFYIRKTGHIFGYGMLCFLLFRAWRATWPANSAKWSSRWAALAILGTAIVASLDEWHQSFIPTRTGRWQDVVIDTCGGLAALVLIFILCMMSRKKEPQGVVT